MYFTCVLDEGHDGNCRPGGTCVQHGEYSSEPGKPPNCSMCEFEELTKLTNGKPYELYDRLRKFYGKDFGEPLQLNKYEMEQLRAIGLLHTK